jgi:hypothetical protein
MSEYLVELYVSRADAFGAEEGAERARLAAEEQTRRGRPMRCLRAIYLPEDETCFLLFEAGSADVVRDAAALAALPFERLAEAIAMEGPSWRR